MSFPVHAVHHVVPALRVVGPVIPSVCAVRIYPRQVRSHRPDFVQALIEVASGRVLLWRVLERGAPHDERGQQCDDTQGISSLVGARSANRNRIGRWVIAAPLPWQGRTAIGGAIPEPPWERR